MLNNRESQLMGKQIKNLINKTVTWPNGRVCVQKSVFENLLIAFLIYLIHISLKYFLSSLFEVSNINEMSYLTKKNKNVIIIACILFLFLKIK
jgi:hypothetical protein